jgi:hypothetical protein
MTDDTPDDDQPGGIISSILELLAEMDERDEREGHGHWSGDRASVDYSISIGSIEDALGPRPTRPSKSEHDEQEPGPITPRQFVDETLCAADRPGVRPADVDVDVDREEGAATVVVENEIVGRVPLDDDGWTVDDVSVNNEVLEVWLSRD